MVQRLYARTLNFGVLPAFAIRDFFANFTSWKDMVYAWKKQLKFFPGPVSYPIYN
jgi:hypothetical protein